MSFQGDAIDQLLEGESKTYFNDTRRDRRRRSRSRDRDRGRRRRGGYDPGRAEERRRERHEKERERDQRTIFAAQIHPKNEEREIFDFFSEVGKVVDIQLIRDTRTLKSKGLAYVEFEDRRSVPHALALSGRNLNGYPVLVQMTQAERGITTPAALVQTNPAVEKEGKLVVKHINAKLTKEDVIPIFNAFGEVRHLQLQPSGNPGENEAFVEFRRHAEASTAMTQLNGLEVVGMKLEISFASGDALKMREQGGEMRTARFEDESGNGGVVMSLQDKQSLMNNLAKRAGLAVPDANQVYSSIPQAKQEPVKKSQKTQCVLLTNMFDPAKETDPDFDLEIREDVREEVSSHGRLLHIYVDKTSKEGRIFLKFESPDVAERAFKALDGRWFAQNRIVASYMDTVEYSIQFPGV